MTNPKLALTGKTVLITGGIGGRRATGEPRLVIPLASPSGQRRTAPRTRAGLAAGRAGTT
jgi:hypothetical protein